MLGIIINFDSNVDNFKVFWIYNGISKVGFIIDNIMIIEVIVEK